MAADLFLVIPELQQKMAALLARCKQRGFEMRPNYGLRSPQIQGALWRQSRSIEEIQLKVAKLRANGAPFLAHCIEVAGPQHGDWATDAPPGYSWHQWGEAVDCFWLLNGKAEWSTKLKVTGFNAYEVYATEAEALGLTAGARFKKRDWGHVQLRAAPSPAKVLSPKQINDAMAEKFGA